MLTSCSFPLYSNKQSSQKILLIESMANPTSQPWSVLIVDDHPMFRWGIRQYLSNLTDFNLVGEASDGNSAKEFLEKNLVDLVLLDMEMPVLDGIGFLGALELLTITKPKIIVLSQMSDSAMYKKLQTLGVNGFIRKTEGVAELANAFSAVLNGESYFSPGVAKRLWDSMNQPSIPETDSRPSLLEILSDREFEVAKLMSQGLSTKKIAEALGCAPSTVKTHRSNLMRKMQARNSAEVARWITAAEFSA